MKKMCLAVFMIGAGALVLAACASQGGNASTESMEKSEFTQETYGWAVEDNSILYHDVAVYEITDAYSYG
ncbi:MAG: hypothetical protein LUC90_10920, partial [Lachnospiraceae bacterium]|nr:hypothetical protein [Lachnospiraceae bacterium]